MRNNSIARSVAAMDVDALVPLFCKILLGVSFVILVWCGLTVAIKSRRDKDWAKTYVPTLGKKIDVTTVRSWLTLAELDRRDLERANRSEPSTKSNPRVR